MSNPQRDEKDDLQKYLEEKAKQEQESENESKILSAYDTCVLKESAKIHELIAEAHKSSKDEELNENISQLKNIQTSLMIATNLVEKIVVGWC